MIDETRARLNAFELEVLDAMTKALTPEGESRIIYGDAKRMCRGALVFLKDRKFPFPRELRLLLTAIRTELASAVELGPEDPEARRALAVVGPVSPIGYGALMRQASRMWRERLGDHPGGEFTSGPCRTVCERLVEKIDELLARDDA